MLYNPNSFTVNIYLEVFHKTFLCNLIPIYYIFVDLLIKQQVPFLSNTYKHMNIKKNILLKDVSNENSNHII